MLISPKYHLRWAPVALLTGCLLTITPICFAHNPAVHGKITDSACSNALQNSVGYSNFVALIPTRLPNGSLNNTPAEWMILGSQLEDAKDIDAGGYRQLNHFYDPFSKEGLSDWPINGVISSGNPYYGQNSLTWASFLNCHGIDVGIIVLPVPIAVGFGTDTSNVWSFQNARSYEWCGLTNPDPSLRSQNLANMFRAIGQVLHLLQDTTSPQHVRNEQHLPYTPWSSPIENYGKKHAAELNYTASMLDWRNDGFTQLSDFWDRSLYSTNKAVADPAALVANEDPTDPTATLGAAEFVNGNFIGQRHSYSELTSTTSRFYYPLPSLLGGTTWSNLIANPGAHGVLSGSIPPIGGSLVYRVNVSKASQGRYVTNHSTVGYIPTMNPSMLTNLANIVGASVDDPDVLKDYHYHLIPTAVKYSAGLIDYYFRGTLGVASTNIEGTFSMIITNTSYTNLNGGNFYLFYDDTNGIRTQLSGSNFTTTYSPSSGLASGAACTGTFTPSLSATNYILVFQGTIGTSGTSALDSVDAGIAIAATSFQPQGFFTQLTWVTPQTNVSGDCSASGSFASNQFQVTVQSVSPDGTTSQTYVESYTPEGQPLVYTGPALNCNLHLIITSNNVTDGDSDFDNLSYIEVDQDGTAIVQVELGAYLAPGTNDYPFTISASTNSQIEVSVLDEIDRIHNVTDTRNVSFSGTLTP